MARDKVVTFFSLPRELRDKVYGDYFTACSPTKFPGHDLRLEATDVGQFKILSAAVPEIESEVIEQFWIFAKDSRLRFEFEDLNEWIDFAADTKWCPEGAREGLRGTVVFDYDPKGRYARQVREELWEYFESSRNYIEDEEEIQLVMMLFGVEGLRRGEKISIDFDTEDWFWQKKFISDSGWEVYLEVHDSVEKMWVGGNIGRLRLLRP